MKVETPQILWNSEGDKNVNAALLSVAVLSCGGGSNGNSHQHQRGDAGNSGATMILATAGNSSVVNLWAASPSPPSSSSSLDGATKGNSGGAGTGTGSTTTTLAFRCSLGRQDGACNCVRFSPNGMHLAAASEQAVVVWTVPPPQYTVQNSNGSSNDISGRVSPSTAHFWSHVVSREQDLQFKVAARNGEAFMDLAWSADSTRLVAGSIDHSVVVCEYSPEHDVWRTVYRHDDHAHFVQGVAFDPLNVYVASMSSDRTVRLHGRKKPPAAKNKGRKSSLSLATSNVLAAATGAKVNATAAVDASATSPAAAAVATTPTAPSSTALTAAGGTTVAMTAAAADTRKLEMAKSKLIKYYRTPTAQAASNSSSSNPSEQQPKDQHKHLFQDEATLESFVRRLAFTVDGAYLVTPAAQWWRSTSDGDSPTMSPSYANATLMFARHKWDEPCRVLVGMQKVRRRTANVSYSMAMRWKKILLTSPFFFFGFSLRWRSGRAPSSSSSPTRPRRTPCRADCRTGRCFAS
jgi:chromatin assembly factor 1 subunit B